MASAYVLWAERLDGRLRIGASDARYRPPIGVQVITIVEACDLRMMRRWLERRVKRGWTVEKMKAACEARDETG